MDNDQNESQSYQLMKNSVVATVTVTTTAGVYLREYTLEAGIKAFQLYNKPSQNNHALPHIFIMKIVK